MIHLLDIRHLQYLLKILRSYVAAIMKSATDIVETVSINRTVQAQTENVSVYFIIRTTVPKNNS